MRLRVMALGLLLPLSLAGAGLAVGQTLEDRVKSLEAQLDGLLARAIILTDQKCASLGPGWRRYEAMSGRFPIAAGKTWDAEGRERTLSFDDPVGGTYSHQLTWDEMPKHDHRFSMHPIHRDKVNHGDVWSTHHERQKTIITSASGNDQPHNNMPPYRVVNFCHKVGAPN